eukprot:GHVH01000601.1.p1 GENE.GHVH01000601.1~~GHVH01000601.1.p1  ORF type:complete len:387 (+),score=45.56 GHVH01000601.1:242-1402(+)
MIDAYGPYQRRNQDNMNDKLGADSGRAALSVALASPYVVNTPDRLSNIPPPLSLSEALNKLPPLPRLENSQQPVQQSVPQPEYSSAVNPVELLFSADELLNAAREICRFPCLLNSFEEMVRDVRYGRQSKDQLDHFFDHHKSDNNDTLFPALGSPYMGLQPPAETTRGERTFDHVVPVLQSLRGGGQVDYKNYERDLVAPSSAKAKSDITWYDDRNMFSAQVALPNGKHFTRSFTVREYDDRNSCLKAAEDWIISVKNSNPNNILSSLIENTTLEPKSLLNMVQDCHRQTRNLANISSTAPVPPPFGLNKKVSNTGIRGITWQESRKKFQCSIYMEKGKRIQKYFPTGLNSFGPRYEEAFRRAKSWMAKMESERKEINGGSDCGSD